MRGAGLGGRLRNQGQILWRDVVVAVLPGHIGRGIGGALLERVEAWLFSEGCSELWLTTEVDTRLHVIRSMKHGWADWKIEHGLRYMRKTSNHAIEPTPVARCHCVEPQLPARPRGGHR